MQESSEIHEGAYASYAWNNRNYFPQNFSIHGTHIITTHAYIVIIERLDELKS